MQVTEAKMQEGWLCLKVPPSEAYKWLCTFKPNDFEIKKTVKGRSKNANALAWALMSEIASKTGIPTIEIYKRQVENIGGFATTLTLTRNAYKAFERAFCKEHIARSVEIIGENEFLDSYDILVTYGSSDYSTEQMSQLIDNILQDCKALGIKTPEDDYIDQLVADWEAHYEQ